MVFPDRRRFQQDNNPKHTSNYTKDYLSHSCVDWWRTPAESPDNPIENVWGSMKYYLRHHYKPKNFESLQMGINEFWMSMTPDVCCRYVSHLYKVMPKVIQVQASCFGLLEHTHARPSHIKDEEQYS